MKARVYVTLKPGVLDPQAAAVQHGLRRLGFDETGDVVMGKFIEVTLNGNLTAEQARARVKEMSEKLLANTVMESYRIEIDE